MVKGKTNTAYDSKGAVSQSDDEQFTIDKNMKIKKELSEMQEPSSVIVRSSESEPSFEEEFDDGYDENLLGDADDKARLMQMTERERELELYNRYERREMLRNRFEIIKRLALAEKEEGKIRMEIQDLNNLKTDVNENEYRQVSKKRKGTLDIKKPSEKKHKFADEDV